MRQSNARFVRWSDGSLQLWLGDEVLDAKEIDVSGDHNYAFVRHQQLIQVLLLLQLLLLVVVLQ